MRFSSLSLAILLACVSSTVMGQGKSATSGQVAAPKPAESKGNSEAEKLKGRRVMVTEEGAEIRTREGGVIWRAYLGETMTVSLVNQDWLWIFERQGWINSSKVIPYETAVYEMNARIKDSRRAENFGLRGIAHLNHGNYKEAIKDFNEVIRRNPSDPGAFVNRGNAYRFKGDTDKAIDDYSKAINLDNGHFLAMNNRALVQTTRKKYELALLDLNAAVALNKEYHEAHNNRGVIYMAQKKYEDAAAEFTQAIKLYPRYADAYINRSAANSKLKKFTEARDDLSRGVLLAPSDADAINDFAWFLATCEDEEFRDGEKALDMSRTAVELSESKSWNTLDTYGAAYAETGKFAMAERYGKKALELAPETEHAKIKAHLEAYKNRKPIRD